jgi:nucleotide-binding universal stress UspA family protein
MGTLHTILVPVDGSPPSLAALDHAVTLANDYGARLEVLHVKQLAEPWSPAEQAEVEFEDAMEAAVDEAREALGERLAFETRTGEPLRVIIERANEEGVELVVIGTHGRVGRLHSLLGSIAEGVVRNAPCPVLTVRDLSGGYQTFAERRRHGRPTLAQQSSSPDPSTAHAPARGR